MENKTFHLIDVFNTSENVIEVISAFLSEDAELIGITEYEDHHSFCFESREAAKRSLETITTLNDTLDCRMREEQQQNWNQIWESEFEPVVVDEFCAIIAPHHSLNHKVKHCITINPEMSFGTGHHETTFMMMQYLNEINVNSKSVLDFGCGTGVLAIIAEKEGAESVVAIDYDQLCYDSTLYNTEVNGCSKIQTVLGDSSMIKGKYDIILANVNRNVLLDAVHVLCDALKPKGQLVLSGLLKEDYEMINETYADHVSILQKKSKGQWIALLFKS